MPKGELRNVEIKSTKTAITITIDPTTDLGFSSSGKTLLVASTGGGIEIGTTGVFVNISAWKFPTKK